jgi:hypothetical protein
VALALIDARPAYAVPSFARQTGQPCAACHTAFPELTPFGRRFKLSGYTLQGGESPVLPLSLMFMAGGTHTGAAQDGPVADGMRANDNFAFQQATGFLAGRIYGDLGAFIQVTVDPIAKTVALDGSDVRYVQSFKLFGQDTYFGITVNNQPSIQDVWNTGQAWGFPQLTSGFAANDVPGTYIGSLGLNVGGAGMYMFWNDMLYAEVSGYRGFDHNTLGTMGLPHDPSVPNQVGTIPYWRLALEPHWGDHWLMIGTYGLYGEQVPGGALGSGTDRYLDIGVDAQYQYDGPEFSLTLKASDTYEKQRLDRSFFQQQISANPTDWLNSFKANATFVWDHTYAFTGGYFNVQGSTDAGLSANGVWGATSATNSPNGDGLIFDASYMPFSKGSPGTLKEFNVRLGVQYTKYLHLYGGTNDAIVGPTGGTRNASGNDTLFLYAWAAF